MMDPRSTMAETRRAGSSKEEVVVQDFKSRVEGTSPQSPLPATIGNKSPSPSVGSERLVLRRGQPSSFIRSVGRSSRRSMNWGPGADPVRLSISGSSMRRKGLKEIILQGSPMKVPWLAATQRESIFLDVPQDLETLSDGNSEDLSFVLDPLEHEWMLTVADGNAESILNLLAKDPSLLSRRDFVTGFTVLHWLAKHGRHEDLIEVISFAEKNCHPFNINVLTASGRLTPLHLAALQGHEMVIKVLVGAFGANTNLRDHNGLKAWQYLRSDASRELKELSGASEEDLVLPGAGNTNNNCAPSRWRKIQALKGECEEIKGGGGQSQQNIPRFAYFRNMFRQALAFFQEH